MAIKGAIILGGYVNALAVARGFVNSGLEAVLVNDAHFQPANFSRKASFMKAPAISSESFAKFLDKLPEKFQKKNYWLIPTCDLGVKILSENKKELEKKYLVLADKKETVDLIQDKGELFKTLSKNHISVPKYLIYKITTSVNLKFPVIIKSRLPHEHDLKKIKIVAETREEADEELKNLPIELLSEGVIVQEYLKGLKQVSFSSFCHRGEIIRYFMSEKVRSRPADFGSFTIIQTIFDPELLKTAVKILKSLKYSGVSEIEFLYDKKAKKYWFLEINPRFWMQNGLAQKIGVDLIEPLTNSDPKKQTFRNSYKIGVKWVHFYSDLLQAINELKGGRFSIKNYFAGLKGEKTEAVFQFNDPIPFYIETVQGIIAFFKGKA